MADVVGAGAASDSQDYVPVAVDVEAIRSTDLPGPRLAVRLAAFLVRASGCGDGGGRDLFVVDDDSIFATDSEELKTAGTTLGRNHRPAPCTARRVASPGRRSRRTCTEPRRPPNRGCDLTPPGDRTERSDRGRTGASGLSRHCSRMAGRREQCTRVMPILDAWSQERSSAQIR